jgi:hypothetical protein
MELISSHKIGNATIALFKQGGKFLLSIQTEAGVEDIQTLKTPQAAWGSYTSSLRILKAMQRIK